MDGKRLITKLSEENNELKQYIDTLNKECIELQAALFEEANKMAQTAYAAEYAAKKRADEYRKENAVLINEVQALKNSLRLHMEENSDVFAVRRSASNIVGPEIEEKRRGRSLRHLNFLRNSFNASPSSDTFPPPPASTSGGSHSADRQQHYSANTSVINVASQEPVTRQRLLDALTSSAVCAETVAEEQFQEFVEWVEGGCSISWPEGFNANSECNESPETKKSHGDQPIMRERYNSDVDEILPPHKQYSDSDSPPLATAPQLPLKQLAFFHRLVREDVAPALEFADGWLCKALRMALGHLGVEIEPLSSLSTCDPSGSVPPGIPKCPLVPGEPARFRIKLEATKEDGSPWFECFQICSWARERIAAVTDLFQYISLIRRGLTGTPTTPANRSLSNSLQSTGGASVDSGNDSDPLIEVTRRHQFENIQRRRLNVALSRLGYGLPSVE